MGYAAVKKKGFLLVTVLLLTVVLITAGLAFLGKRAVQYRRAALLEASSQARALAEAGLEDAMIKFRRDLEFPPLSLDQSEFTYTESFQDADGDTLGYYTVTIDGSYRDPPYLFLIVSAEGRVGADPIKPLASRTLRVEIDLDLFAAGAPDTFNPYFRAVRNFEDLGGI
ncbi:MAG: hypothetical protein WC314_13245 [Vulcanimicrobiota bacterium]